jgi:hypothetical protein
MSKPTIAQMRAVVMDMFDDVEDEDVAHLEFVTENLTGTWRHGTEHQAIVRDLLTNKLYAVDYRMDKDGDYNNLRDKGELVDNAVYPVREVKVMSTRYIAVKEEEDVGTAEASGNA